MLRTRILTALVLLLIVAAAVSVASPWPMLALLAIMCACAWWEWLRLVPCESRSAGWLAVAAWSQGVSEKAAPVPVR